MMRTTDFSKPSSRIGSGAAEVAGADGFGAGAFAAGGLVAGGFDAGGFGAAGFAGGAAAAGAAATPATSASRSAQPIEVRSLAGESRGARIRRILRDEAAPEKPVNRAKVAASLAQPFLEAERPHEVPPARLPRQRVQGRTGKEASRQRRAPPAARPARHGARGAPRAALLPV